MNFRILSTLLYIIASLGISNSAFADKYVIGKFEGSSYASFCEPLLKEAYGALGHELEFRAYPAKRSIVSANRGSVDGDLIRAGAVTRKYKNLVLVPQSISEVNFYAVTLSKKVHVEKWMDLKKYRVGILSGHVISEQNAMGSPLLRYNNFNELSEALILGKVNTIVLDAHNIRTMKKNNPKVGFMVLKPALISIKLYHVLHKKHKKLVPLLNAQFETMLTNGTIHKYNEMALGKK